ncbi:hypothetical protein, partial [Bacillus licheniformis]|uniref:hypothetical protein n=1 Tax=Bacillus licheniformis TaxID=1402 RepID=UPI001C436535
CFFCFSLSSSSPKNRLNILLNQLMNHHSLTPLNFSGTVLSIPLLPHPEKDKSFSKRPPSE